MTISARPPPPHLVRGRPPRRVRIKRPVRHERERLAAGVAPNVRHQPSAGLCGERRRGGVAHSHGVDEGAQCPDVRFACVRGQTMRVDKKARMSAPGKGRDEVVPDRNIYSEDVRGQATKRTTTYMLGLLGWGL